MPRDGVFTPYAAFEQPVFPRMGVSFTAACIENVTLDVSGKMSFGNTAEPTPAIMVGSGDFIRRRRQNLVACFCGAAHFGQLVAWILMIPGPLECRLEI